MPPDFFSTLYLLKNAKHYKAFYKKASLKHSIIKKEQLFIRIALYKKAATYSPT